MANISISRQIAMMHDALYTGPNHNKIMTREIEESGETDVIRKVFNKKKDLSNRYDIKNSLVITNGNYNLQKGDLQVKFSLFRTSEIEKLAEDIKKLDIILEPHTERVNALEQEYNMMNNRWNRTYW